MPKRSEPETEDTARIEGAASVAPRPKRHDRDGTKSPAVFLIEELPAGFRLPARNDNDTPWRPPPGICGLARRRSRDRE